MTTTTTTTPDPLPILYACVAKGPTVLAELVDVAVPVPDGGDAGDLRSLAGRCLEAAPLFHRLYTHTVGGRTYAFLLDDPLVFFAIADESLPSPEALLFLRRLRDALSSRRRSPGPVPLPTLCLQDELLPVLRRLILPLPAHNDPPPPPPPPASPPSDAPLNTGTPSGSEDGSRERQKKAKKGKKKRSDEAESRMEISVEADHDADADPIVPGGRRSAQMLWRRHVRMILLLDLVICSILFATWLSVCRGFQCIAS